MLKKALQLLIVVLVLWSFPCASEAGSYAFSMDSPLGQALARLPENQWMKLNVNRFQDVWVPADQRATTTAGSYGGPYSVIQAWSSMAWDGNRGDLIFWGGGHANYPGNEIYRWRASTLSWERASLPSAVRQAGDLDYHFEPVDGMLNAPIPAHTYDNSEFLPLVDRWVTFGGAVFNGGAHFRFADGTVTGPYFWDPSKANANQVGGTTGSQVNPQLFPDVVGGQMWENRNNIQFGHFVDGATGYAQENGKDVLYVQALDSLVKYTVVDINDPSRDTYEKVGKTSIALSGQGAGAFDPDRNLFLRTSGPGVFTYWRLDSPGPLNGNSVFRPRVVSGTFDFSKLTGYGLDYDPVRKVYVLWNGDPVIWILKPPTDLATGEWVLYPEALGSAVAPDKNTYTGVLTGILGKWKYVRELDVFLGVWDHWNGDIWAYKPKNWQPVPPDNHAPFVQSPREGEYFLAGSDVTLTAGVIDADKSIAKVEFFRGDVKLGESFSPPYQMIWSNVPSGVHEITAVAVDGGVRLASKPVKVTASTTDPSIKMIQLQEGINGYAGTRDAYIQHYFSSTNYGWLDSLIDNLTKLRYASLIRFSIFQSEGGPIPDGAVIESASLNLYKYTSYDHVYNAFTLLRDWKEGEVTWNQSSTGNLWASAGALGSGTDIAPAADGQGVVGWAPQWLKINVTPGVTKFSQGAMRNYGWKIESVSGNSNEKRFYSREASDPALRPALVISYREVTTGNVSPTAAVTAPAHGSVFAMGETITVSAEANDTDGSIAKVEFFAGATKLGETGAAPYTFAWTPTQPGSYVLKAVATDDQNARTTSAAVTVTVLGTNAAPAVALTTPAAGAVITRGESVVLGATATDPDGHIVKVEFFAGATKLGETGTYPYTLNWTASQAGVYSLSAIATDNDNAATISSAVSVTVAEAAAAEQTIVLRDGLDGYSGTRDAYLYGYGVNAAMNFGQSANLIDFVASSSYTNLVRFAVFQSEGGPVPDGAVIESAVLSLYKLSSYNYSYRLHPLLKDWKENEVTWNRSMAGTAWSAGGAGSYGNDLAATPDGEGSVGWNPQWLSMDVTGGIRRISSGVTPNYGWRLVPVGGNWNMKVFSSREYGNASLRPTLTIKYRAGN